MGAFDPIKQVWELDANGNVVGSPITDLPQPNVYQYGLEDIGEELETEDGKTTKIRQGQKVVLGLGWKGGLSIADASTVLSAFRPIYVRLEYLDGQAGAWLIRDFKIGAKGMPLYSGVLGLWEGLAFEAKQRDMDVV